MDAPLNECRMVTPPTPAPPEVLSVTRPEKVTGETIVGVNVKVGPPLPCTIVRGLPLVSVFFASPINENAGEVLVPQFTSALTLTVRKCVVFARNVMVIAAEIPDGVCDWLSIIVPAES